MGNASTITRAPLGHGRESASTAEHTQLVLLVTSDDLSIPSSRHVLDDIDEVRFGRGPRTVTRHTVDGSRILELTVPDQRMSTRNGAIVRTNSGWVLQDPASKNGAIVDGEVTRRTAIVDGTLFELGHTFFLFRHGTAPAVGVSLDVTDDEHGSNAFATFDGVLAEKFTSAIRIARGRVSILLVGETGTGKELVARALHGMSGRNGAFVAVNCGALPGELIEAELFGSRRGSFTGATTDRVGFVRSADGGTLFLDEVGELPPTSQAAFLRVLQEREVTPVGADRPVKVDLRLFAATLRDLVGLVDTNEFRRDLYARLFGFTLALPALRDRRADLGILLRRLVSLHGAAIQFAPDAMRALLRYDWPFNIRELAKVLETASALATDRTIQTSHLPDTISRPAEPEVSRDELHAKLVAVLVEHRGNVAAVSKALGTRRTQVYRWIERYRLDIKRYRR